MSLPSIGRSATSATPPPPMPTIADKNLRRKERKGVALYTVKGLTDRPTKRSATVPVGAERSEAASVNILSGSQAQPVKSITLDTSTGQQSSAASFAAVPRPVGSNGASLEKFLRHSTSKSVSAWRQQLEHEKGSYHSVSTWVEVMLRRVQTETKKLPSPNPLRTAVCAMLLTRLATLCHPYQDLLGQLIQELLNGLYVDWCDFANNRVAQVGNPNEPLFTEYDEGSPIEVNERVTAVASLKHRQTFFQAYHHLQAQRMKVIGRPARVLEMTVNIWRRKIERLFFLAWRYETRCKRELRNRVVSKANTRAIQRDRAIVTTHFKALRTYVFERRHQCRVVYEEKHRVQLVHRMGRRIKELEEENERLRSQFDGLTKQQWEVGTKLQQLNNMWDEWKERLAHKEVEVPFPTDGEDQLTVVCPANFASGAFGGEDHENNEDQKSYGESETGADAKAKAFNDNAILGLDRRRSDVRRELEADGRSTGEILAESKETVEQLPDRMKQLKDFLGFEEEAVASPEGGIPVVESRPETAGGADAAVPADAAPSKKRDRVVFVEQQGEVKHDGGDGSNDALHRTAKPDSKTDAWHRAHQEHEEKVKKHATYREVLEWVSLRVQLIVSGDIVMKRCTNFTTDFSDCVRLAYLLVSLGAEKGLFDDVFTAKTIAARAEIVCEAAASFFDHDHPYRAAPLQPLDIIKGKGAKISKFLFTLYDKFKKVPLMLPKSSTLNPRLVNAARTGTAATTASKDTPLGLTNASASDKMDRRSSTFSAGDASSEASAAMDDATGDPIPDYQFLQWYRDLANEDSDVDLDEDEVASLANRRKTLMESAAERIADRLSKSIHRASISSPKALLSPQRKSIAALGSPLSRQTTETGLTVHQQRALRRSVVKREALKKDVNQVSEWVAEKLALVNNGNVPDFDNLSNAELLEALIYATNPSATSSADKNGPARLKVIQQNLARRFHLNRLHIRPQGRTVLGEEKTISFKQLLTALYVLDSSTTIGL